MRVICLGGVAALVLAGCGSHPAPEHGGPIPSGSGETDAARGAPADAAVTSPRDGATPDAAVSAPGDARPKGLDAAAVVDGQPAQPPPSSDAGFFGASRCGAELMFCEDFEGDVIDPVRWSYGGGKPDAGTGYAAIDLMRAARGNHALHFHTEMNPKGSGSQVKQRKPEPRLADGFYMRAFMYFAQPIPDHHLNYFYVVDPTPTTGGMFTLGSLDGKLGMVEFGPHNGDRAVTGAPLIVGRWFCVEWQVHPSTSELRTWVDEVEVPALHVTNWSPSQFSNFFMELISSQGSYDMWVDELAYDPQRIGCRR
jgi:hypothetical protein